MNNHSINNYVFNQINPCKTSFKRETYINIYIYIYI